MKCPECVKEGKKSRVTPSGGPVTAMYCAPYYDEDGAYHHHDRNLSTTNYSCSNGHQWQETNPFPKCVSCDWPNVKEKVADSP